MELRQHLFDGWRAVARRYGFREYDGPPLETLELYTAKSGDEIVHQLYHFDDKGGRAVSLRPEMTPTLARLVAASERHYKKPIKWYAIPQLFRYERQQKGRLREHFQFNADIVGEPDPAADAELIALLIDLLRGCGLAADDFRVRLSSRNAWRDFFRQRGGQPEREYDFYQIVDKLERTSPEESARQLDSLGISFGEIQDFIRSAQPTDELSRILDGLEAHGLRGFVQIDYAIVRGLAYYTGPVFEAFDGKGRFRAIAGGGRYDHLLRLMSGGRADLPAAGFGLGDVVLTELLRERQLVPPLRPALDAFFLIEDQALRPATLRMVHDLRAAGFSVDYPLSQAKSDKQFKRALELGAIHTLRLEPGSAGAVVARVKHLASRAERIAPAAEIAAILRGALPSSTG